MIRGRVAGGDTPMDMRRMRHGLALGLALVAGAGPAEALQATVTWTDNSPGANNATVETGFRVERRDGPDTAPWVAQATVAANVTTYNQTGLQAGVRYCYRVIALGATSNAPASPMACSTPDAPLPASGLSVIFAP
jgi:hypothetical protein